MLLRATTARNAVLDAILLPIIIREFVSRLYVLERHDEYATLIYSSLCIRATGMIYIPRLINRRFPVYGFGLRYLKEVLALTSLGLFRREHAPDVFDDATSLWYRLSRKETESCR